MPVTGTRDRSPHPSTTTRTGQGVRPRENDRLYTGTNRLSTVEKPVPNLGTRRKGTGHDLGT